MEVGGKTPRQWDRDDLGKFVGMAGADRGLELGVAITRGFDQHRELVRVLGLAFPPIDGAAGRKNVDAGGKAFLDQRVRELRRAVAGRQIRDDEIGIHGTPPVSPTPRTPSATVGYPNRPPSSAFLSRL